MRLYLSSKWARTALNKLQMLVELNELTVNGQNQLPSNLSRIALRMSVIYQGNRSK